jgi:NADPH-dependent 2,4-dienoyl-CoA reductase/sulfur reductase-like enzyme
MAPSIIATAPVESAFAELHEKVQTNGNRNGSSVFANEGPKGSAPHLDPSYKIIEQPIGNRRPIRVACMGAGYSGLMMAIVFSESMQDKNAELVVYERNEDLGGTWLENR